MVPDSQYSEVMSTGSSLNQPEAMRQHIAGFLAHPKYRRALRKSLLQFNSENISSMVMFVEQFREMPVKRKRADSQTLTDLIAKQETQLIRISSHHFFYVGLHTFTFTELVTLLKTLRKNNLLPYGSENNQAVTAHLQVMERMPGGKASYLANRKLMKLVQRHWQRVDEVIRLLDERGTDTDTLSQYLNHEVRVMAGGAL